MDDDGNLDRVLGIPFVPVVYVNNECGSEANAPFDFTTMDPSIPVLGDIATLSGAVAAGGLDMCADADAATPGIDGDGLNNLAGAICMQAIMTDDNGNGFSDMADGCAYMESLGMSSAAAANATIEATCNALGVFSPTQCATVALSVEAQANAGAVGQCSDTCEYYGGLGNLLFGSCAQTEGCLDTDNGATDSWNYSCEMNGSCYGGYYDDEDFNEMEMCCQCGGGTCGAYASATAEQFGNDCGAFCNYSSGVDIVFINSQPQAAPYE
jgi:hypothetical protein